MERRNDNETAEGTERKPSWIKVRLPNGREFWDVKQLVEGKNLFTVCEEAHCPNRYECWNQGTATFMIAGERCTRACGFCATRTAKPGPLDPEEPQHVAEAVVHMKLRHAVITMVTRDDLPDGAAAHFAQVIRAVRKASPSTIIEVLASDLNDRPISPTVGRNSNGAGTWRQELMQRPWTVLLTGLFLMVCSARTTSLGMAQPTLGQALPSQSLIKKMSYGLERWLSG